MSETLKSIRYKLEGGQEVELSIDIVRRNLLSEDAVFATDQEIMKFINLCRYQKLNPFLNEAYLIKTGTDPAQIIIGKDVFTKRASQDERCLGWEAGVILEREDQIIYRTGAFATPGEKLLGGWAAVYRSGWEKPVNSTVSLLEYQRFKGDGSSRNNWEIMPATMIRKVALVQSLREAFPDTFQGMYSSEELSPFTEEGETKPECQGIKKPPLDSKDEYLEIAVRHGLSEEEAKKVAEAIGQSPWDSLGERTFRPLIKKFQTEGAVAGENAKLWLKDKASK